MHLRWIALAGGVAGATVAGAGIAASAPRYRGPATDHFDGRRFRNQPPVGRAGLGEVLRWIATRRPPPWPEVTGGPAGAPPPREVAGDAMRVTFVNHATALVQVEGFHLLTDPIWSTRCGPAGLLGPRRVRPPGVPMRDLPRIDAVLVSHDHYDHLDLATLRRLDRAHRPRIVTTLGNRGVLVRAGLSRVTELDWWQRIPLQAGVSVTCVPARHFSGRGLLDSDGTLWAGFVVGTPSGKIYFAGDTGAGPHFARIRRRLGPMRLALLPIGAYLPRSLMEAVHLSPEEAVEAHVTLGAKVSVGIHYGTFRLADEGRDAPAGEVEAAVAARPEAQGFRVLGFGEGLDVPA